MRIIVPARAFLCFLFLPILTRGQTSYDILSRLATIFDPDELIWSWSVTQSDLITLSPIYVTQPTIFGCNVVEFSEYPITYSENMLFVWKIPKSDFDNTTFLQADLKLVHYVTGVNVHLPRPTFDLGVNYEYSTFEVAFSLDGLMWGDRLQLDCKWQSVSYPPEFTARYMRFYRTGFKNITAIPEGDVEATLATFAIFGYHAEQYDTVADYYWTKTCPGFQTRIDIDFVSSELTPGDCNDQSIDSYKKKYPQQGYTPLRIGRQDLIQQNAFHSLAEYFPSYQKCSVALFYDVFQSDWNGFYEVSGGPQGKISRNAYFGVLDDGEDDEQLYISTSEQSLFVSAVPYTVRDELPVLDQVDHMRNTCKLLMDAEFFRHEDLDWVQMGDTNNFMQSVIHLQLKKRLHLDVSEHKFLTIYQAINLRCNWVNPETKLLETSVCTQDMTISGLICFSTEGEIRSLRLTYLGCDEIQPPSLYGSKSEVNLTLVLESEIVGCITERVVRCAGVNELGREINSTVAHYVINCYNSTQISVISHVDNPIIIYECTAPKMPNDESSSIIAFTVSEMPRIKQNITADPNPLVDAGFIRLNDALFGEPLEILLTTRGFPLNDTSLKFREILAATEIKPKNANLSWTEEFLCTDDPIATPIMQHKVKMAIAEVHSSNTGRYDFHIDGNSSLNSVNYSIEIIHPFKLECSHVCGEKLVLGQNLTITCVLEHHLITEHASFDDINLTPLLLKIDKIDLRNDFKFCEYSVPVRRYLTSNDFEQGMFEIDYKKRQITFDFQVFSIQSWNAGKFAITVKPSDPDHCIYQSESGPCSDVIGPIPSCSSTSKSGVLVFELEIQDEVDYPELSGNRCGDADNFPLYFHNWEIWEGSIDEKYKYYYRFCRGVSNGILAEAVCSEDGGEYVFHTADMISKFSSGVKIFEGLHRENVFKALTCRSYRAVDLSSDRNPYELQYQTNKENVVENYQLSPDDIERIDLVGERESIICRYRRGKVWNMFSETAEQGCVYAEMNPEIGPIQNVGIRVTGNMTANVTCVAWPDGAAPVRNFSMVEQGVGFGYYLLYPEDVDTERFTCCQIYPTEMKGEVNGTGCFEFPITSRYYALEVNKYIEPRNLLCNSGGMEFSEQPCYNETVQLQCCMRANPVLDCDWLLRLGEVDVLLNGERNISWELKGMEDPQCHRPEHCSILTFDPLTPNHKGYYSCVCYNGMEGTVLETTRRIQSQFIEITEHQSQPVGKIENIMQYHTTCANPPEFYGTAEIPGLPVTADVKCRRNSDSPYFYLPDETVTVAYAEDTGNMVTFDLYGSDRDRECQIEVRNSKALTKLPYKIDAPLKRVVGFGSLNVYQDTSNPNYKSEPAKVCCDVCAFQIRNKKSIKIECRTETANELLDLANLTNNYNFNSERNLGRKCEQLLTVKRETVGCTCSLVTEPKHAKTLFFRANGDVDVQDMETTLSTSTSTMPNQGGDSQQNPDRIAQNSTTVDQAQPSNPAPETTTTSISSTKSTTEPKKSPEQIREEFQRYIDSIDNRKQVSKHGEQSLNYEDTAMYFNDLSYFVKEVQDGKLTTEQVDTGFGFVDKLKQYPLKIKLMNEIEEERFENEEDFAREKISTAIKLALKPALSYVELLVSANQNAPKKLPYMVTKLQNLQDLHFHFGSQLRSGMEVEVKSEHSHVKVMKMPESAEELESSGDLTFSHVDEKGVTRGATQGAKISKSELDKSPPGSTIVISSYDKTVDKPIEKRVSAESKLKRNGRNIDEIQLKLRTQKRVSDQFYVDIRDPSGAKVSVGAVTSFNFHKSSPEVELTDTCLVEVSHGCVYWDSKQSNFSSEGMEPVFLEPSRATCKSNHLTPFAAMAYVTQTKIGHPEKTDYHWTAKFGLIVGVVVLVVIFEAILYLYTHLDEDEAFIQMVLIVCLTIFIGAYLVGAEKHEDPAFCAVISMILQSSLLAFLGAVCCVGWHVALDYSPHFHHHNKVPLAHLIVVFVIPVGLAIFFFTRNINRVKDSPPYTCFAPSNDRIWNWTFVSVAVVYYLSTLVAYIQAARNLRMFCREVSDEKYLDTLLWPKVWYNLTNAILMNAFGGFAGYAMKFSEGPSAHIMMGLIGAVTAIIYALLFFKRPESKTAFLNLKADKVMPKKKKKAHKAKKNGMQRYIMNSHQGDTVSVLQNMETNERVAQVGSPESTNDGSSTSQSINEDYFTLRRGRTGSSYSQRGFNPDLYFSEDIEHAHMSRQNTTGSEIIFAT